MAAGLAPTACCVADFHTDGVMLREARRAKQVPAARLRSHRGKKPSCPRPAGVWLGGLAPTDSGHMMWCGGATWPSLLAPGGVPPES